jgi:hypothetical protein
MLWNLKLASARTKQKMITILVVSADNKADWVEQPMLVSEVKALIGMLKHTFSKSG